VRDGNDESPPVPAANGTPFSDALAEPTLRIDLEAITTHYNDIEVSLTPNEFLILSFLCQNAGKTQSPESINKEVWGEWYSGSHHIHVNINRLRKKLNQAGFPPGTLVTVRGFGYRLDHKVLIYPQPVRPELL